MSTPTPPLPGDQPAQSAETPYQQPAPYPQPYAPYPQPYPPAPPTVPVTGQAPAPGQSASQGARQDAWSAWPGGQPAVPPTVPLYIPPTATPAPGRPRRVGILITLALLAALLVGAGGGAYLTSLTTGHSSAPGAKVVLGASSAPNVTVSSNVSDIQTALQRVAATVEPSVVKIISSSGGAEAIGSGDILTSDGYIVTNDHVVNGFSSFNVIVPSGASYTARVVGEDAQDDLAVIKIAATGLKPVAIADSSRVAAGSFAIAIGYPLGNDESATFGVVSGLGRAVSEAPSGPAGELADLIQTSAQLNPGNSGGALVNLKGQLIGIPTLEATNPETNASANGVGYAISSNRMSFVVKQLIASGQLTNSGQGFLGIQSQDANGQGVQVVGFANDGAGQSPAQAAGIQAGDIITAVNGKTVTGGDDLAAIVLTTTPGTKISVTVQRASGPVTVALTVGERPASGA